MVLCLAVDAGTPSAVMSLCWVNICQANMGQRAYAKYSPSLQGFFLHIPSNFSFCILLAFCSKKVDHMRWPFPLACQLWMINFNNFSHYEKGLEWVILSSFHCVWVYHVFTEKPCEGCVISLYLVLSLQCSYDTNNSRSNE